jgi:phosphoribosylformimino-5-aminoimidazole carboxamide ribotide isomerase
MLIIPSIDLKDGCVVRFTQGRLNKKIYSKDPLKTAKHWVKQGAKLIHIIDLDGAITGSPKNLNILKEIAKSIKVPIQFGGGIRSIEAIKSILALGIERVVLGTRAIEDRRFLMQAFREFKDRIIVSVDAKAGNISIQGWRTDYQEMDVISFARSLKAMGFKQLIYTNILKDGTLKGPDIKGIRRLLKETALKIIASGGISSLEDILRLKLMEKNGLVGIIVGKALYEGRFTLPQALKIA